MRAVRVRKRVRGGCTVGARPSTLAFPRRCFRQTIAGDASGGDIFAPVGEGVARLRGRRTELIRISRGPWTHEGDGLGPPRI